MWYNASMGLISSPEENVEVNAILQKLEGIEIPHVTEKERRSAVERAVKFLKTDSSSSIETLLDVIGYHEAQLDVHAAPSEPSEPVSPPANHIQP
jgi:hypothetical protein